MKLTIIISILLSVFFSACSTNSLKSGISGTLQYGEGSCVFGTSFRTYAPYSGYVYFINSVTADSSSLSTTSLLSLSDSTMCSGGKFNLKLEVGTYYICIREYSYISTENYFTVQPNETTEQNFFIFKCI